MSEAPFFDPFDRRRFLKALSLPLAAGWMAGCGTAGRTRDSSTAGLVSDHPMAALRVLNEGVVTREMRFESPRQPVHVGETTEAWHVKGEMPYVMRVEGEGEQKRLHPPPVGMRSGVPLGGLGAGTVEIRADGRLRDWQIFNNSPAGGEKVDLDAFFLGIRTQIGEGDSRAWALRTHPPEHLPGVDRIAFGGAFPVARLIPRAEGLPLDVAWYAYSPFIPGDAAFSGTPAFAFTLLLYNPGRTPVQASVMCNLPNVIQGTYRLERGLTLTRSGDVPTSGTITLETVTGFNLSTMVAGELADIWQLFEREGHFDGQISMGLFEHGAAVASAMVEPGATQTVTFIVSWHFPHRTVHGERVGQGYASTYASAPEAARAFVGRLPDVWESLLAWQAVCFDNALPIPIQDALTNSPSILYKSALRAGDGHWRFWETPSYPMLSSAPGNLIRGMPLALFYPDVLLDHLHTLAALQEDDGHLPASLGTGGRIRFGTGTGPEMADNGPAFVLLACAHLRATGDRDALAALWPHVRKAMTWQTERAGRLGLPERLENGFRWWQYESKELSAYGGALYLAALQAAVYMASLVDEPTLAAALSEQLGAGVRAFDEAFWTGDYYRAWRSADEAPTEALQSDTLHGLLWTAMLDLPSPIDEERARRHLRREWRDNASPYGLFGMRHADRDDDALDPRTPYRYLAEGRGGPTDSVVWQAATFRSAALALWLDADAREVLDHATRVAGHQYQTLRDPWNVFEIQAGWDGSPWAYSHHPAHLAVWLLPLALSGQRYDAITRRLSFAPRSDLAFKSPFVTPNARGTIERRGRDAFTLRVIDGRLILEELRFGPEVVQRDILLEAGQTLHSR